MESTSHSAAVTGEKNKEREQVVAQLAKMALEAASSANEDDGGDDKGWKEEITLRGFRALLEIKEYDEAHKVLVECPYPET